MGSLSAKLGGYFIHPSQCHRFCFYFVKRIDPMAIINDDVWTLQNERTDVSNNYENF